MLGNIVIEVLLEAMDLSGERMVSNAWVVEDRETRAQDACIDAGVEEGGAQACGGGQVAMRTFDFFDQPVEA